MYMEMGERGGDGLRSWGEGENRKKEGEPEVKFSLACVLLTCVTSLTLHGEAPPLLSFKRVLYVLVKHSLYGG